MSDTTFYTFKRATGIHPSPQEFAARANAAIAGAANTGPTSLFVHRTSSGYATYFAVNDAAGRSNKGLELAQAYGSSAQKLDELPESMVQVPYIAKLVFRSAESGYDTQYGADPADMARALSQSMPDDSWVGFSIRRAKRSEKNRNRKYVDHRLGTGVRHTSKTKSAVVFSVYVGAHSRHEALMLANELPTLMTGFDSHAKAVIVPQIKPKAVGNMAFAILAGIAIYMTSSMFTQVPELVFRIGYCLAAIILGLGLLSLLSLPKRRVYKALRSGHLPRPSPPPMWVRPPRREHTKMVKNTDGSSREKHIAEHPGGYPLAKDCFLFEATVFASAGNPHGSSMAGAVTSSDRAATPELVNADGPVIGETSTGDIVPIPAHAMRNSTMIFGEPGSGKSVLTQGLWSWHCAERVNPSGKKDHPGAESVLIAFETKGNGVDGYLSHSAVHGDKAMLVDALDPATPVIDPFDFGDVSLEDKAERITSAFSYAFEDGSIMGRSKESLRAVYHVALAADHYDIANEDWMGDEASHRRFSSPVTTMHDYAHALLMGHTPEAFDAIIATLSTLADRLKRDGDLHAYDEITEAVDAIMPIAQMSPSARRSHTEAPRNKIDIIRRMHYYTRHDRPMTSFEEILSDHRAVVINLGSSTSGGVMDDEQSNLLGGLLIYNLQSAIKRVCHGWQDQGRFVTVFCDEFSMLAGSNDDVMTWMRDRGRSYGLGMVFGTQFPGQLSQRMLENVFSYHTVATYTMVSNTPSEVVAKQLSDEVTADEIRSLEKYHLLMETSVEAAVQPPVTVAVKNFNEDVDL